jgi:hypothetical protein
MLRQQAMGGPRPVIAPALLPKTAKAQKGEQFDRDNSWTNKRQADGS